MERRGLLAITAVLALAAGLVVWALQQPNTNSHPVVALPWTVPAVSAGSVQADLSNSGQGYAILPLHNDSERPVTVDQLQVVPAKGLVVQSATLVVQEAAELLAAGGQTVPAVQQLTIYPDNSTGSVFVRFSLGCRTFGPPMPYQVKVLFNVRNGPAQRNQVLTFNVPVNLGNRGLLARRLPACQ